MTPNETIALSGARVGLVVHSKTFGDHVIVVDAADYPAVAARRWCVERHGRMRTLYAASGSAKQHVRLHAFLMASEITPGTTVDHVDHDGLNNVRTNLRITNMLGQGANQRTQEPSPTHPYRGVSRYRNGRWRAGIQNESRQRHLGYFDTAEQAAEAYNQAARETFGEFAHLNDIPKEKS